MKTQGLCVRSAVPYVRNIVLSRSNFRTLFSNYAYFIRYETRSIRSHHCTTAHTIQSRARRFNFFHSLLVYTKLLEPYSYDVHSFCSGRRADDELLHDTQNTPN